MADVPQQVVVQMLTEFVDNFTVFTPSDHTAKTLDTLLDQVVAWSTALAGLRAGSPAA